MSGPGSITSRHLQRLAVVYVRQSTLAQVRDNTESTARQYALAAEAVRLGWDEAQVLTIDSDLGLSGRSAGGRGGFQELVSRVCLGEVGAILGLEVSRLARSSADLQRLVEFCSLTDTLIIDADGVYDLRVFNDRLLLGLKGTMSEAELHILAGRLQESKRAAARRGELRLALPIGYVYDDDGRTIMDANDEVRAAVADVFSSFEASGSAYGVVADFGARRFPRRESGGAWSGELRWGRLGYTRVLSLLSNPAYAGAYVYGRNQSRRGVDPDGTIRTRTTKVALEQWSVLIHDRHPAYISWEAFLANKRRLAANHTQSGARPPREGTALLQGIVFCGGCGRAMSTSYSSGGPYYECGNSRVNHTMAPGCRSVVSRTIDVAVAERLFAAVAPEQIALALAAAEEVTARRNHRLRALELQVERARYEAARAERAFHRCEPENRLVARSLEQRWEEKLVALGEAETTLATSQAAAMPLPPRDDLAALAADLPRLWAAPTTSPKDRKRLLRTLVADVTLVSERRPGPRVRVGIRWCTGAAEELVVLRTRLRKTPAAAIELMQRFSERSLEELVTILTAAGLSTGAGLPFTVAAVRRIRDTYQIPPPSESLIAPGELTVHEVAARLHIAANVVYCWIVTGRLRARRLGRRLGVPFSPEIEATCKDWVRRSPQIKLRAQIAAPGGAV
jgi:DNA invertase Pin-like site-specific DNA recombinase